MATYTGIVGTVVFLATNAPEKYVSARVLRTYSGTAGSEVHDDSLAIGNVTAADLLVEGLAPVKLSKVRKDASSPVTVVTDISAAVSTATVATGHFFTLVS